MRERWELNNYPQGEFCANDVSIRALPSLQAGTLPHSAALIASIPPHNPAHGKEELGDQALRSVCDADRVSCNDLLLHVPVAARVRGFTWCC